jgi:hypothetical protein
MDFDISLIESVYESMNIYYGLIVYSTFSTDFTNKLITRDYPLKHYETIPDLHTIRGDMMRYRLFYISETNLAMFLSTFGPFYKDINFVLTLGKNVNKYFKWMTRNLYSDRLLVLSL